MNPDEDMLIRHGDFMTLMAVLMALLDRTGGQITLNLDEANGLFAQWRLGFNRTDAQLSLALVSPEQAKEMQDDGCKMDFFE